MTLSTLVRKEFNKMKRTSIIYLLVSLFCCAFGMIYEYYSHGVYSIYMWGAFLIPLVLGTVVFWILSFTNLDVSNVSQAALDLYHMAVATWTIGSIVQGVLEIYGTTNHLTVWYGRVGIAFLAAALLTAGFMAQRGKKIAVEEEAEKEQGKESEK